MTDTNRLALVLAALLLTATTGGILVAGAANAQTQDCESVTIDAFRFDNSTIDAAANGSASAIAQNTKVTVEQSTAFVRVDAENPNGYCVDVTADLDEKIVSPAELGTVDSVDENNSASWSAVQDFERQETFTRVEFTLGPGENATFAPSRIRVQTLKWTGTAKSETSGILAGVKSLIPSDDLAKKSYTFSPESNGSSIITVDLTNESSDRRVGDWHAVYQHSDSGWKPVQTDASAPVYYETVNGGNAVEFHFDEEATNASVEFTANPGLRAEADYQWKSYTSPIRSLFDEGWF